MLLVPTGGGVTPGRPLPLAAAPAGRGDTCVYVPITRCQMVPTQLLVLSQK